MARAASGRPRISGHWGDTISRVAKPVRMPAAVTPLGRQTLRGLNNKVGNVSRRLTIAPSSVLFSAVSVQSVFPSEDGGYRRRTRQMTNLRFILATLALSTGVLARAESAPSARPSPTRTPVPVLAALDADRNGVLSTIEIAAAPAALTALDVNEDGLVSLDELRAPASNEGRRMIRVSSGLNLVLTLDANHDGEIQPMEIANAVSSLKRLDLNSDGMITPDELRAALVRRGSAI